MNPSDKEDKVAIDLGTVYKFVNVAGIHRLSWHQTPCPNAITRCQNKELV